MGWAPVSQGKGTGSPGIPEGHYVEGEESPSSGGMEERNFDICLFVVEAFVNESFFLSANFELLEI